MIILLIAPLASCGNAGEEGQSTPAAGSPDGIMTGQRAPDFMLNDLNGNAFRLSELRNKKPVFHGLRFLKLKGLRK